MQVLLREGRRWSPVLVGGILAATPGPSLPRCRYNLPGASAFPDAAIGVPNHRNCHPLQEARGFTTGIRNAARQGGLIGVNQANFRKCIRANLHRLHG